MAKMKETPVSQKGKGESIKPSKSSRFKSSALSQEVVLDSDDEDHVPERKDSNHSSKVSSSSKTVIKPGFKPSQVPSKARVESSSESEDESEEDESSDDSLPDHPVAQRPQYFPIKFNGVKRTTDKQRTGEESEGSEEEEEESDEPPAKRARTEDDDTILSDSSEDEVEDESEDEKNEQSQQRSKDTSAPKVTTTSPPKHVALLPAKPFQPPEGFVPLTIPNEVSEVLAGEQIWHITAPSDVPLSSITEVALTAIQSSQPILTHNGSDYVLSEETQSNDRLAILLPQSDGYSLSKERVGRTLHLQQKIELPNPSMRRAIQSLENAAAADIAGAAISNVRPQPKGLRMRYKPSGYGRGRPSMMASSESEDENGGMTENPSFQFPRTLGAHGNIDFHARECPRTVADMEKFSQKPKKRQKGQSRHAIDGDEAHAGPELSHQQGTSKTIAKIQAKRVVIPELDENHDVSLVDGFAPGKLSKEERAKQKEGKRKQKDVKLKAKEAEV